MEQEPFCGNQYLTADEECARLERSIGKGKTITDFLANANENIDYSRTSCVHSMLLIHEVQKYDILYNTELPDYKHKASKEPVWLEIHRKLFPNFDSLDTEDQEAIRKTVRRRWKSLRDCLVKAIRLNQKMNAHMKAMSFLIPYLHVSPVSENAIANDSMDVTENHESSYVNEENSNSLYGEDTQNVFNYYGEGDGDQKGEVISIESEDDETILSENSLNGAIDVKDEKFPKHQYPPDKKYTCKLDSVNDADECISARSEGDGKQEQQEHDNQVYEGDGYLPMNFECQMTESLAQHMKRKRCCVESDVDFTVLDILQQNALDLKDEDRMFLLSILSDFKRVPSEKKLRVKAKIVDAIAQALE